MVATNDDLLIELKKIRNLLNGLYIDSAKGKEEMLKPDD